jgi:hypothetical protein
MTSTELQKLRKLPNKQAQLYKHFSTEIEKIKRAEYWSDEQKKKKLAAIQEQLGKELSALQEDSSKARQELQKRATSRAVKATGEAVAKVRRLIDRGVGFSDLVRLLAEEGDRAGLAALDAEVPWLDVAGALPAGAGSHARDDARATLQNYESQLWTAEEKQANVEALEAKISEGMMESNQKNISAWLERAASGLPASPPIERIYRHQGLAANHPDHDPRAKQGFGTIDELIKELDQEGAIA